MRLAENLLSSAFALKLYFCFAARCIIYPLSACSKAEILKIFALFMARNTKIDQTRGALIALVIIGHIVLGSVHEQVVRYAIYAFHMPLFIALSGYLINTPTLQAQGFAVTLKRYWQRALKPFALAFAFFTGVLALHAWQEGRLDGLWFANALLTPYYHLWFVPTLVIWVIGLAIILKVRIPLWFTLLGSVAVSLLWASSNLEWLPKVLAVLVSKKVVYFFSFFVLGVWLRRLHNQAKLTDLGRFKLIMWLIVMIAFAAYWQGIGPAHTPLKAISWYSLNTALFGLCLSWITTWTPTVSSVIKTPTVSGTKSAQFGARHSMAQLLEMMGRLSLPIYLWHVLPMFLLKGFDLHESHTVWYYLISIVACLGLVYAVRAGENRSAWADAWFYGVPNSTPLAVDPTVTVK